MSLGISTNYNSLNGLGLITGTTSGYGMYGGYGSYGFANEEYVNNYKKSLENGYDVRTTQQSYNNKQATETMSFSEHCQAIQYMFQEGRSDDALIEFSNMVNEMSELGQYQGYSEKQLKTLAQDQYHNATGSTIIGDIQKYADSSFVSGVKNSIPIVNIFMQDSSQSDLISEVTGTKKSLGEGALKISGSLVGGAAFGALAYTGVNVAKNLKNNQGILKSLTETAKNAKGKMKWIALGGAALGAVCLGIKSLFDFGEKKANHVA